MSTSYTLSFDPTLFPANGSIGPTLRYITDASGLNRGANRSFLRPSTANPCTDYISRDTNLFGPRRNTEGFSVQNDDPVPSGVSRLLNRGRPLDVPRFVVSGVLGSVDGMSLGRGIANIGKKCLKRIPPSITDSYASSAITTLSTSALERILSNDHRVSTRTMTLPDSVASDGSFARNDCQSSKYLASSVNDYGKFFDRIENSHDAFLCKEGCVEVRREEALAAPSLAEFIIPSRRKGGR